MPHFRWIFLEELIGAALPLGDSGIRIELLESTGMRFWN